MFRTVYGWHINFLLQTVLWELPVNLCTKDETMTHYNVHNRKYVPGQSLTKDFRELVVHKLESQGSNKIAGTVPYGAFSFTARSFSVSEGFVHKIWKLHCTGSGLSPKTKRYIKGSNRKLTEEDEKYIQLLVTSNPTIYHSEVHNLLLEHSNAMT